jgi:hypothetical protein
MRVPGLDAFFRRHVQQGFGTCGLAQPPLVDYVSGLLTRFARVSSLFPFRSADGRPIETIAGLLLEWHAHLDDDSMPPDRTRERLLVRHMADYTLFMSGVFRERLRSRGQMGYYRAHGQQAFARCARLEAEPQRARVFARVSHDFQPIADALDDLWQHRLPIPDDTDVSPLTALWRA